MKSKLIFVAVVCLLTTAAADGPQGQEVTQPKPRAQVYALEALAALGGFGGCAVVGGCAGILAGAAFLGPMFHAQGYDA